MERERERSRLQDDPAPVDETGLGALDKAPPSMPPFRRPGALLPVGALTLIVILALVLWFALREGRTDGQANQPPAATQSR